VVLFSIYHLTKTLVSCCLKQRYLTLECRLGIFLSFSLDLQGVGNLAEHCQKLMKLDCIVFLAHGSAHMGKPALNRASMNFQPCPDLVRDGCT